MLVYYAMKIRRELRYSGTGHFLCVQGFMYVCTCMYVCMYVCMYIYIYIYIRGLFFSTSDGL